MLPYSIAHAPDAGFESIHRRRSANRIFELVSSRVATTSEIESWLLKQIGASRQTGEMPSQFVFIRPRTFETEYSHMFSTIAKRMVQLRNQKQVAASCPPW
jgi:hypothetical protein